MGVVIGIFHDDNLSRLRRKVNAIMNDSTKDLPGCMMWGVSIVSAMIGSSYVSNWLCGPVESWRERAVWLIVFFFVYPFIVTPTIFLVLGFVSLTGHFADENINEK